MNIDKIEIGEQAPDVINVVIEIPANSTPVKYEVDNISGAMTVDRFMNSVMFYPANYGFVPHTLSEDGDPLDVLVVTPYPLVHGALIPARPVGVLLMTDEAGKDAKIIAYPLQNMTAMYDDVHDIDDVPTVLRTQIKHFFENYKSSEAGKWAKIEGWGNVEEAKSEVVKSIERVK